MYEKILVGYGYSPRLVSFVITPIFYAAGGAPKIEAGVNVG